MTKFECEWKYFSYADCTESTLKSFEQRETQEESFIIDSENEERQTSVIFIQPDNNYWRTDSDFFFLDVHLSSERNQDGKWNERKVSPSDNDTYWIKFVGIVKNFCGCTQFGAEFHSILHEAFIMISKFSCFSLCRFLFSAFQNNLHWN